MPTQSRLTSGVEALVACSLTLRRREPSLVGQQAGFREEKSGRPLDGDWGRPCALLEPQEVPNAMALNELSAALHPSFMVTDADFS
jgi:hypothetical protein